MDDDKQKAREWPCPHHRVDCSSGGCPTCADIATFGRQRYREGLLRGRDIASDPMITDPEGRLTLAEAIKAELDREDAASLQEGERQP